MLYEDQAARFDARAGIPPEAARAVAEALAELAAPRADGVLLEAGAGTGAISLALLDLPLRYVGFDRSPAMLDVFRARLAEAGRTAELHVADGNGPWPAADGSVSLVFGARVLHHLDPAHAAAETRRVLRAPAGVLAVGRVRRPPESVKAVLRREMRRLLRAEGFAGRDHGGAAEALFALLEAGGARRLPLRTAARWTHPHRPADSLAAWREKEGLAGRELPAGTKARVLDALAAWARDRFGALDAPLPQEEWFEIEALRVPAG